MLAAVDSAAPLAVAWAAAAVVDLAAPLAVAGAAAAVVDSAVPLAVAGAAIDSAAVGVGAPSGPAAAGLMAGAAPVLGVADLVAAESVRELMSAAADEPGARCLASPIPLSPQPSLMREHVGFFSFSFTSQGR